ncbi:MAG: exopolygalacturonase, partial [Bacteroidaceae bacterium]|nr:exopolygalacturonase [Bacteroidaceae bacterium]
RINFKNANRVIWFKMRPDTPQHYEQLLVEDVKGTAGSFLVTLPWTQFFKPEEREDMPLSRVNNIVFRNVDVECKTFFNVKQSEKYALADFTFENCKVKETDKEQSWHPEYVENMKYSNLEISK